MMMKLNALSSRIMKSAPVMFAACAALACASNESTIREAMTEGRREYDRGRYAEALGMYRMAEELDPERPEPAYFIGRCYIEMADQQFAEDDLPGALRYCDRAIATFDKAIASFPGYGRALQGKADALKLRGRHQAAYDIAQWVSAQSGFASKKLILEARQYAANGDLDRAQLTLTKAVAVDPNSAAPHAELGRFYLRTGNRTKAIESLRRAYQLDPGAPGVFSALLDLGAVPEYPIRRRAGDAHARGRNQYARYSVAC